MFFKITSNSTTEKAEAGSISHFLSLLGSELEVSIVEDHSRTSPPLVCKLIQGTTSVCPDECYWCLTQGQAHRNMMNTHWINKICEFLIFMYLFKLVLSERQALTFFIFVKQRMCSKLKFFSCQMFKIIWSLSTTIISFKKKRWRGPKAGEEWQAKTHRSLWWPNPALTFTYVVVELWLTTCDPIKGKRKSKWSRSVVSDSLLPHGL